MDLYIPPNAYEVMKTVYNISPLPRLAKLSLFMMSDYNIRQNKAHQYYFNEIESDVATEIMGECVTLIGICILFKYLIFLFLNFKNSRKKKSSQFLLEKKELKSSDTMKDNVSVGS